MKVQLQGVPLGSEILLAKYKSNYSNGIVKAGFVALSYRVTGSLPKFGEAQVSRTVIERRFS
jgi:hypothetical protein